MEIAAKACPDQRGVLAGECALRIDFVVPARGLSAPTMNEHDDIVVRNRSIHARSSTQDPLRPGC